MRGLTFACAGAVVAAIVFACGEESSDDECCPPDPTPGCCMAYGGHRTSGGACSRRCDGMPLASNPGWALVDDAYGCKVWREPTEGPRCGQRSDASTGHCCPPDPAPGCCMVYGGWSESGGCATSCDGMPIPSTPGWKLVEDDHGCQMWSQPSSGAKCGQAMFPDAASDASDAASDASDAAD